MRGTTAAGKLMALHRLFDKAGGLFLSLSLVARKPHPLPNDGPARLLFVHFVAPYCCKFPQPSCPASGDIRLVAATHREALTYARSRTQPLVMRPQLGRRQRHHVRAGSLKSCSAAAINRR